MTRERCGAWMPVARVACALADGHSGKCRTELRGMTIEGRSRDLLKCVRHRAHRAGIPFDLTRAWMQVELENALANGCPYLGIPIRLDAPKNDAHLPSVDRFDPKLGYVQTNCIVVSYKANAIKNDCPAELLEKMGANVGYLSRTRFREAV